MLIEIGCKKAGYTPKQIAPMFERAANLPNVYLPKVFREVPDTWEKKERKRKPKVINDTTHELTDANLKFKEAILSVKSGTRLDELISKE